MMTFKLNHYDLWLFMILNCSFLVTNILSFHTLTMICHGGEGGWGGGGGKGVPFPLPPWHYHCTGLQMFSVLNMSINILFDLIINWYFFLKYSTAWLLSLSYWVYNFLHDDNMSFSEAKDTCIPKPSLDSSEPSATWCGQLYSYK